MQRSSFLAGAFLTGAFLAASATAQTTIDLTNQAGTATCSYPTGAISSTAQPGHLAAQLTGTPSPPGCSSGSSVPAVTFGPASPLAASSTSLAGGTSVADTFTVLPLNAVSCSATITTTAGTGTGSLTNGSSVCSTQAACTSTTPFSIPATFTNTSTSATSAYNVTVTCNAANGASPASTSSSVSVTQAVASGGGGGSCATIASSTPGISNFTQLTGNQNVFYFGMGAGTGNQSIDVTSYASFWFATWPGQNGRSGWLSVPTNRYMSLAFTVPAAYFTNAPSNIFGQYDINASDNDAPISMTISTKCGDFSNPTTNATSSVLPGCWINSAAPGGFIQWSKTPGAGCNPTDGQSYYLNYINADISNVTPTGGTAASSKSSSCGATTCKMSLYTSGNY